MCHLYVDAEKYIYNFCTNPKKDTAFTQHSAAQAPTRFSECAAHGTKCASGFIALILACSPVYMPAILAALS